MSHPFCPTPAAWNARHDPGAQTPSRSTDVPAAAAAPVELRGDRRLHAISPRPGLVLRCTAGSVWVTQDGMPDDVVLFAGQSFTPRPRGKIVVQSLDHAR